MTYPLVLELAADGIAVTLICRVLGFSAQGFYRWKASPVTDRDWADAHLINAALGDPRRGAGVRLPTGRRRATRARHHRRGEPGQRLCSAQRIWSLHSKKRGLNRKAGKPMATTRTPRRSTASASRRTSPAVSIRSMAALKVPLESAAF